MQCPACHNEVEGQSAFCNHCGAPLSAAPPAPGFTEVPPTYSAPPPGYAPPPAYPQPAIGGSSGLSANAAAAVAYIFLVPAIIFLAIEPYNKIPLVRFHSFQSIALCVVWFALWVFMTVLSAILHFIPFIYVLIFPIYSLVGLGLFILWLIAIIKASQGEFYKIPFIGDFAMKQAQS